MNCPRCIGGKMVADHDDPHVRGSCFLCGHVIYNYAMPDDLAYELENNRIKLPGESKEPKRKAKNMYKGKVSSPFSTRMRKLAHATYSSV